MQTREEAIEHLTALGLDAVARDCALGATVFVGTAGEDVGGVTAYKRVIYIVPHDGSWTSLELDAPRPDDENLMSPALLNAGTLSGRSRLSARPDGRASGSIAVACANL